MIFRCRVTVLVDFQRICNVSSICCNLQALLDLTGLLAEKDSQMIGNVRTSRLLFSCFSGRLRLWIKRSRQRPLEIKAPRQVYSWCTGASSISLLWILFRYNKKVKVPNIHTFQSLRRRISSVLAHTSYLLRSLVRFGSHGYLIFPEVGAILRVAERKWVFTENMYCAPHLISASYHGFTMF